MLKNRQIKALKLMIEGDLTDKEIAEVIKVSPQTICTWKKNEEFKKEFKSILSEKIFFSASKALRKEERLLDSGSDKVAQLAAKDLLDRAGYAPTNRVEQEIDLELNVTVDYGDDME